MSFINIITIISKISWPHFLFKATMIFLALMVATAFYIAVSTTAATESVVVPTLPPMFPLIPIL